MKQVKKNVRVKTLWESILDSNLVKTCEAHPQVGWILLGGLMSLGGGAMKIYANEHEYDDWVLGIDEQTKSGYKIPAKRIPTLSSRF